MPVTRIRIPIQHHRRHRPHRQNRPRPRPLRRYVLRMRGQVVGVQPHMRRRVVRGIRITRVIRQRSLGTRLLAPASGRIVVRVIPTVPEAMARVQVESIPGIRSKSVCFTLNPIHRRACGLLIAGAFTLLAILKNTMSLLLVPTTLLTGQRNGVDCRLLVHSLLPSER